VRLGLLNYCAFHTILPTMQTVIAAGPESAPAKKLDGLPKAQLQAYEQLMAKHDLSREGLDERLKQVAAHSDHYPWPYRFEHDHFRMLISTSLAS
jgi:hypothetical protein